MSNQYIIQGPIIDEEPLFWSDSHGWSNFNSATRYNKDIFTRFPPLGGISIYQLDADSMVSDCFIRVDPPLTADSYLFY